MQRRTEGEAHEPTLTVAAVARRLGVAPTTLRTWDRRYGLGPSLRASGAHRRYTTEDVARLEAMRRLVLAGVTPAEAARVALAGTPPTPAETARVALAGTPPAETDPAPQAGTASPTEAPPAVDPPVPAQPVGDPPPVAPTRFAGTGGRVLPLTSGSPQTRGLARAAMSLDTATVTSTLEEALDRDGVVATWEHLLRPVLIAVGQRWEQTGEGVEVEHLLAECAARVLHRRPLGRASDGNPRPALLACMPAEQHMLPLLVLTAALGETGISCLLLGAATPLEAMGDAVRRCGPAAVVLWSQLRETADATAFEAVPRLRPPTTLIAAGQGWVDTLPEKVLYARDLRQGIDLVTAAVRGS